MNLTLRTMTLDELSQLVGVPKSILSQAPSPPREMYAIVLGGAFIGGIVVSGEGEVMVRIFEPHQRKGYASEALRQASLLPRGAALPLWARVQTDSKSHGLLTKLGLLATSADSGETYFRFAPDSTDVAWGPAHQ